MKRTTPSQEVSHFEIGWLAGIIDGEGSLAHYYSMRGALKPSPFYGVIIVNSDMEIINIAKSIYARIGLYSEFHQKSASKKLREGSFAFTKPCYELTVRRRRDVEALLKIIAPHLVGYKKQKAEKMLDFFSLNPFNSKRQLRV